MSVLSVQSVSYSYKTKYQTVQAVKDVSCDLSAGTFYALVGKSGSGKTTLLSLLAGLDTPQSGDIIVGGQSLREIDVDIYRRKQAPAYQKQESGIQNKSYPELQFFLPTYLLLISTYDTCYEYPDYQPHNQTQYNTYRPL